MKPVSAALMDESAQRAGVGATARTTAANRQEFLDNIVICADFVQSGRNRADQKGAKAKLQAVCCSNIGLSAYIHGIQTSRRASSGSMIGIPSRMG
ncbi:MAG: hypothetical protein U1E28_18150 [Beijerinckiaceae bacterium]